MRKKNVDEYEIEPTFWPLNKIQNFQLEEKI